MHSFGLKMSLIKGPQYVFLVFFPRNIHVFMFDFGCLRFHIILPSKRMKCCLGQPNLSKFPGGRMPPDPLVACASYDPNFAPLTQPPPPPPPPIQNPVYGPDVDNRSLSGIKCSKKHLLYFQIHVINRVGEVQHFCHKQVQGLTAHTQTLVEYPPRRPRVRMENSPYYQQCIKTSSGIIFSFFKSFSHYFFLGCDLVHSPSSN